MTVRRKSCGERRKRWVAGTNCRGSAMNTDFDQTCRICRIKMSDKLLEKLIRESFSEKALATSRM